MKIKMPHKCKYCGKVLANLTAHVKAVHPDKYKKGKRAETYGELVEEKKTSKPRSSSSSSKPRSSKKVDTFRLPRGSYLRTNARNPDRKVRLTKKLTDVDMALELASEFKKKGVKARARGMKYQKRDE
jgi:hypothetical protein